MRCLCSYNAAGIVVTAYVQQSQALPLADILASLSRTTSLMQGTLACIALLALFALLALVLAVLRRHEAGPGASRTPELLVSCDRVKVAEGSTVGSEPALAGPCRSCHCCCMLAHGERMY